MTVRGRVPVIVLFNRRSIPLSRKSCRIGSILKWNFRPIPRVTSTFHTRVMPIERVVLYARVSTLDKGQDVENQLVQLRKFCQRQGWNVMAEYIDPASAKTANRSQFQAMLAAASRREFDLVLFWSLDRFSREGVLETLQHLQQLSSYGVEWRSFTEQYLDSCGMFKDAVLSILATIAKQERSRISERTVAGLERAKAKGKLLGRRRVRVDSARVTELRAAGKSFTEIAEALRVSRSVAYRAAVAS
jgi:DNA invertase Pin-like site-specific DNA recombinase